MGALPYMGAPYMGALPHACFREHRVSSLSPDMEGMEESCRAPSTHACFREDRVSSLPPGKKGEKNPAVLCALHVSERGRRDLRPERVQERGTGEYMGGKEGGHIGGGAGGGMCDLRGSKSVAQESTWEGRTEDTLLRGGGRSQGEAAGKVGKEGEGGGGQGQVDAALMTSMAAGVRAADMKPTPAQHATPPKNSSCAAAAAAIDTLML
eukprot:365129-Chlamydomonas_euryale.AAC.6